MCQSFVREGLYRCFSTSDGCGFRPRTQLCDAQSADYVWCDCAWRSTTASLPGRELIGDSVSSSIRRLCRRDYSRDPIGSLHRAHRRAGGFFAGRQGNPREETSPTTLRDPGLHFPEPAAGSLKRGEKWSGGGCRTGKRNPIRMPPSHSVTILKKFLWIVNRQPKKFPKNSP